MQKLISTKTNSWTPIWIIAGVIVAGLTIAVSTGCTGLYDGDGSLRIGMVNSNFLEIGHTVDGDKEGKKAKVEFQINQSILDAVLPSGDDPSGDVVSPSN